jgi:TRAP transporter 4TM/12TM fusion protein
VANVVTTGPFTIPLMKRVGFKPVVAAGVEACASTGGMVTPPIMGATAFVVAAYLGIPYFTVALAAAIPMLCYFVAIFANVDFYSRKNNLKALPKEEMPNVKAVLKEGFHLLIPIVTLVYWLAAGYTASLACFWAIIALFGISFFKKSSRPKAESLLRICESATRATIITSMACAAAGIIVSSTTLSGVGLKLGTYVVSIAQGQLWLACIISAILAVVVGMGLTTTAVYIIMVVTVIPPLIQLGVLPLAAHMYALFWGTLSNIIPPVAIASFAAAGIAKTGPMETAVQGFYIGIPGLFVFASILYNPALLFVGAPLDILVNTIGCIAGVTCCAAAIQGFAFKKINILLRLTLFAASLVVLSPRWDLSFAGALVGVLVLWQNYVSAKKNEPFDTGPSPLAAGGGN